MANRIDRMEEANNQLYGVLHNPKVDKDVEESRAKRRKMIDVVKDNRLFFLETMLTRHVDNYLNYLSSLLFDIFTQRRETLKSSEKIEIETVLNCESITDVVKSFAEKKVESLSFSSIKELYDFFKERFKLELFSESLIPTVVEAIETRNISVHNRCIINKRYVSKTGADEALIGKKKDLSISQLDEFIRIFLESVKVLDKKARSKLKIRGHRLSKLGSGINN
jgi:hypothetical protein